MIMSGNNFIGKPPVILASVKAPYGQVGNPSYGTLNAAEKRVVPPDLGRGCRAEDSLVTLRRLSRPRAIRERNVPTGHARLLRLRRNPCLPIRRAELPTVAPRLRSVSAIATWSLAPSETTPEIADISWKQTWPDRSLVRMGY